MGGSNQIQAGSRPAASEWLAIASAAAFLISLFALSWFAYSLDGDVVPGSTGDAFRWLHGLDLVLFLTGLAALGAAFAALFLPAGPATLLVGLIAGIVATFLIIGLMISPPEGGEAIFGASGGNPAGEIVPQRGALVGLFAAFGIGIANWVGISRWMEEVAALRQRPAPVAKQTPPESTERPARSLIARSEGRSAANPKKPKTPKAKPASKRPSGTKKAAASTTKRRPAPTAKPKPAASRKRTTSAKSAKPTAKPDAPKSPTAKRKTTRTRKPPKPS